LGINVEKVEKLIKNLKSIIELIFIMMRVVTGRTWEYIYANQHGYKAKISKLAMKGETLGPPLRKRAP
jgi:hypothetical protein